MTTAKVRATGLPKDDVQRVMDHYLVDETTACQALALAPASALLPKRGTELGNNSIVEAPFPVGQVIGAISGGVVFAVIAKKNPKFITQFIAIPVGVGVGVAIAKVF